MMLDDDAMVIGVSRRWLVLFALLMRIIIPSGFMLDAAAAAHPSLVACDGRGPIFSLPSHEGAHHHGHHGNHGGGAQHGDCPYSAAAGAADGPTAIPGLAAIAPQKPPAANVETGHHYRPVAAASPPPSTGPPVLA